MAPFNDKYHAQPPGSAAPLWPQVSYLALIAIAYWLTVRIGLLFVVQPEGISPIWPVSGLALGVLLLNPRDQWGKLLAVIFFTNVIANWNGGNSLPVSLGFALANTLETSIGVWALTYFCKSKITFKRTVEVLLLFGFAIFGNGISAMLGAAVSALAFDAPFLDNWFIWWASNGLGIILITPIIVTWTIGQNMFRSLSSRRLVEVILLALVLVLYAWVLSGPFAAAKEPLLAGYMLFPLLIWLAFRFSPRGMANVLLLFAIIAIWNTLQGYGIFASANQPLTRHLISVQIYLGVAAFSGLLLSTLITEGKQTEEALRGSERRERERAAELQTIMDTVPTAVSIAHDPMCQVVTGNRALYKLLHMPPQSNTSLTAPADQRSAHFKIHIDGIEQPPNELPLQVSAATGVEIRDMEEDMVFDDGRVVHIYGNVVPLFDEQGKPRGAVAAFIDITERRQAEQALRAAEANYRSIFEQAPIGIFQSTPGGRFLKVNQALAHIYGHDSPEELIETVDDIAKKIFVDPSGRREFTRLLTEHGQVIDFESLERRKDGSHIWTSNNAQVIKDADGQILCYEGFIRDITKRKQAEEEAQKLASIVRYSSELVNLAALDGRMIFLNEAGSRMLGINPAEVGQHTIMEFVPEQWVEMVQSEILPAIKEKGRWEGDLQYHNIQTHAVTDVHAMVFMINDAKTGAPLYMANVSRDITERKLAEDEILEKSRELEALFAISSQLRTAQTTDDMFPVVLAQMSKALNTDGNAIILLSPDQTHFTCTAGEGPFAPDVNMQFDVENSISGHVLQTGQPYVTLDYSNDPFNSHMIPNNEWMGPVAIVPLQSESEFIGTLLSARVKDSPMRPFTPAEVQLLISIGEMFGNALRRAHLYDDALSRLQRVQGLRSIDSFINANMDMKITLKLIVGQALSLMNVDAAIILLYNPDLHMLEYATAQGFHHKDVERTRFDLVGTLSEKAIMERHSVTASNLSIMQDPVHKEMMQKEGFVSCYITPMIAKGKVIGVLEVYKRVPIQYNQEWIDFLEALGAQAAIAFDNAHLFRDLQTTNLELILAYDATIQGWSQALDLKDSETEGHTLRVTEMTVGIARLAGLSEEKIIHIRRGALLHDIGKMGVPDHILNKTGKLTTKEWNIIRQHPQFAYNMLRPIEFLRPAMDIPYTHHEKWDGTGYPQGLQNTQIPYAARLFAVADVWDALTNNRIYRKAWSKKKAFAYIHGQSGKHFDPQVVELFLKNVDKITGKHAWESAKGRPAKQ